MDYISKSMNANGTAIHLKFNDTFPFYNQFCCCLGSKSYPTLLQPHGLQPTRLLCPQDFPSKNTGMGCHFLLQRIFLVQDQTQSSCCVSCIAGGFFITEPLGKPLYNQYRNSINLNILICLNQTSSLNNQLILLVSPRASKKPKIYQEWEGTRD